MVVFCDVVQEIALQPEERLLELKVYVFLGPIRSHLSFVVTEYMSVEFIIKRFLEVFLRDQAGKQVFDLFVEVEFQDLLDHNWQMVFNREHFGLKVVDFVTRFIND